MDIDTSLIDVINLLAELTVYNQYDFAEFLQRLLKIIVHITPTDACLIYFFDADKKQLTLIGSKKPHDQEVGNITMKQGEGITGWVAEHKQTVVIEHKAFEDPRFKFFSQLPEDQYESFLSVPILSEAGVVGVMNFQNKTPQKFSTQQIQALESLGKLIASAFVNTVLERQVTELKNQLEDRKLIEKAKGILMKARAFSEDEAFKHMRQEAMNNRKSIKEIAEAILLVWQ